MEFLLISKTLYCKSLLYIWTFNPCVMMLFISGHLPPVPVGVAVVALVVQ